MSNKLQGIHGLCIEIADQNFTTRLQKICEFFLNTSYGDWGMGSGLKTLDDFSYKLEILDCVTYVEVVLALAKTKPAVNLAEFTDEFTHILRRIQYANGKPEFISRNHFMCIDWIPNNKFIVEDITTTLTPTSLRATAIIDKLNWVLRHKITEQQQPELTTELVDELKPKLSDIPYVATTEFLQHAESFKNRFPECCIVNIVRPNWDLSDTIGTHLNISHLGFAFNSSEDDHIKFYHATSERKCVVQETLFDYMTRFKDSPTVRGFNVLVISPGYL